MKTVLRPLLFIALLALSNKETNAQCAASDITIQNIVAVGAQTPGTCVSTFDLSFTMQTNNGNKFIFFHAWRPDLYPDYFECVNGLPSGNGAIQAPGEADLADAFLNIGIDNSGADPVLLSEYPNDGDVTLNSATSVTRTILPDGSSFFVIRGVMATLPGDCDGPILLTADFWSSQSAGAQVAQCVSCANKQYALNFLQGAGLAFCLDLTYNATITNRTGAALAGTYQVYADVNNDGFLNTTVDALVTGTTSFTIAAGSGMNTPITGSIPGENINQNLLVIVTLSSPANGSSIFRILSSQCSVLPVTFKSFTATRTNSTNVGLRWETASEINNSGFAIQRNMGNNNWQTIGFIPSKAQGGNSDAALVYTYNDINSNKGITQYRIQQVDVNGMAKFSEIRAVRGDAQNGKMIVYPNPSADGRVSVVFEDKEGARDIILTDMSGRIVKQWRGILSNTVQIENLGSGMYSLRVTSKETGIQTVEKIVVSRN